MNKTGTIVTIIIVVIIVVVAVFIISSSGQTASTPAQTTIDTAQNMSPTSNATTSSNMVTLTDSGFSPSTITVNNGDSVTFVNDSAGQMWVASNPHPTHTDLPGFDEHQSVGPGQSWTYTFTVTGTHGYHNHTNPSTMGVVIVQ